MPVYWSDELRENEKPNRIKIKPRSYGEIPAAPGQEEEEERLHPSAFCPCEMCQSSWVGDDAVDE